MRKKYRSSPSQMICCKSIHFKKSFEINFTRPSIVNNIQSVSSKLSTVSVPDAKEDGQKVINKRFFLFLNMHILVQHFFFQTEALDFIANNSPFSKSSDYSYTSGGFFRTLFNLIDGKV